LIYINPIRHLVVAGLKIVYVCLIGEETIWVTIRVWVNWYCLYRSVWVQTIADVLV